MVAFLGYREVVLLIFPEFSLLLRILSIVLSFLNSLCPSSQSFPPFYSDILKSQGNHWFLCFVLWSTGHVLCPSLSRFCFPVLHPFLPLVLISLKVYDWLPISEHAEVTPFSIPLLAALLLYLFFSDGRNQILPVWKSSTAIPFFIFFHAGSPRHFPHAPWEVVDSFLFSCWVIWRLRGTWLPLYFLCFFFCPFLSNCLNLLLTVLTRLKGSELFSGLWGSLLNFLL